MFKVHKPTRTPHSAVDIDALHLESPLPKPKVLKSCIRCRKHKTKCDAHDRQPGACTSCEGRGVACKIDYVLPPQRSDNLKNLRYSVDDIERDSLRLETGYNRLFHVLGMQIESYESWRSQRLQLEEELAEDFSLIKLSDSSFISLQLISQDQLLYNNNLIPLNELQQKIKVLVSQLNTLHTVLLADENGYESDSTSSSAPSPHSPANISAIPSSQTLLTFFDLDLSPETLLHTNKLLLVQILEHFYPSDKPSQFLADFLDSFFTIILASSKSLTSSTYSTHVLTSITAAPSHFSKSQLAEHVGVEVFNGDGFLRQVVGVLGLNAIMNGDFVTLRHFIAFVERKVCTNRKKLHFDQSPYMRLISMALYLMDSFQGETRDQKKSSLKNVDVLTRLLQSLNKLQENPEFLKRLFKRFLAIFVPVLQHSEQQDCWIYQWIRELEAVIAMTLIPSFPEFHAVLTHSLIAYDLVLENPLRQLIDGYCKLRASSDATILKKEWKGLCCHRMDELAKLAFGTQQPGVRMAEIQLILEQVDWKKDSTDDVLKKMGVL